MNIALDTNILIWGMQGVTNSNKVNQDVTTLQQRCGWLLKRLADEAHKIYLSNVVIGELLTGMRPESHGSYIGELQQRFHLLEFDLPSAVRSAQLWQAVRAQIPADQTERRCLRADVMIVASASVAGCRQFYTHEPSVRKMSIIAGMEAPDLPTGPHHLFADLPKPQ